MLENGEKLKLIDKLAEEYLRVKAERPNAEEAIQYIKNTPAEEIQEQAILEKIQWCLKYMCKIYPIKYYFWRLRYTYLTSEIILWKLFGLKAKGKRRIYNIPLPMKVGDTFRVKNACIQVVRMLDEKIAGLDLFLAEDASTHSECECFQIDTQSIQNKKRILKAAKILEENSFSSVVVLIQDNVVSFFIQRCCGILDA